MITEKEINQLIRDRLKNAVYRVEYRGDCYDYPYVIQERIGTRWAFCHICEDFETVVIILNNIVNQLKGKTKTSGDEL